MITRRGLIGSLLTAPAIIRTPGLLMPIKRVQTGWVGPIQTRGDLMVLLPGTFRYAILYADPEQGPPMIEWVDYGASITDGETFTFTAPSWSLADETEGEEGWEYARDSRQLEENV